MFFLTPPQGLLAIVADPALPKRDRLEFMTGAARVTRETDTGLKNFAAQEPADPANGMLWPSDPAKNAPRGSVASWSFAVPAAKLAGRGDDWKPLERVGETDPDFLAQPVIAPDNSYGGRMPGKVAAAVLSTTSHDRPQLVAFTPGGPLVAHHEGQDPPVYSRHVFDIDGQGNLDEQRHAGLHTVFWVRRMPTLCGGQGKTVVPGQQGGDLFAVMLNATRSKGDQTGWLSARFAVADGALSAEVFGPLIHGAPKHNLGNTADGDYRAHAVSLGAYFGDGTDPNTGPKETILTQWEPGAKGPFVRRVERRPDRDALHPFLCGPRKVVHKIQTWTDFQPQVPPVIGPPTWPVKRPPITGDPPTLIVPPEEPVYPVCILPESERGNPSVATPDEVESPSLYLHAFPGLPDADRRRVTTGAEERAGYWKQRYGVTEQEFQRSPIVGHVVGVPVYTGLSAVATDDPNRRWPVVKTQHETLRWDEARGQFQRKPAFGDGSTMVQPGALLRRQGLLGATGTESVIADHNHGLIALAFKNAGNKTVDGRLGVGARSFLSPFVASGAEFKLGFAGDGATLTPDLYLTPKTEEAAELTDGTAVLHLGHRLRTLAGRERRLTRTSGNLTLAAEHDVVVVTGAHTVTLPATIVAGRVFEIRNTHGSAITVARNGNTINGAASDYSLAAGELAFIRGDATGGWWLHVAGTTTGGGGGITDLVGDVLATGPGSATATIPDETITFAKMQHIATDKLLGRTTAGTGDVEEVTCTDFAQGLLDDADAAAARTTLGLGTVATESTVPIAKGGTGSTTAAAGRVTLLPAMAGNAGKVLTVNAGATDAEWTTPGSSGGGYPEALGYMGW